MLLSQEGSELEGAHQLPQDAEPLVQTRGDRHVGLTSHRELGKRRPDLARAGLRPRYSGVSNCQMKTPHMATNTTAESNHLGALERFMVSSLGGVHQVARLADRLQPTPQGASVRQSILRQFVKRKEPFAACAIG